MGGVGLYDGGREGKRPEGQGASEFREKNERREDSRGEKYK